MSWRNMSREYMSKSLQRTWKDQRLSVATKIRVYRVTGALCTYMLQKRNVDVTCAVSKVSTQCHVRMLSFSTDTTPQSFAARSLPCRWYVVRMFEISAEIRCAIAYGQSVGWRPSWATNARLVARLNDGVAVSLAFRCQSDSLVDRFPSHDWRRRPRRRRNRCMSRPSPSWQWTTTSSSVDVRLECRNGPWQLRDRDDNELIAVDDVTKPTV